MFSAECHSQQEAKLLRCRDEKWFNAGPFGRSAAKPRRVSLLMARWMPRGWSKLSSMLRHTKATACLRKNWQPRRIRTPITTTGKPTGTLVCVDKRWTCLGLANQAQDTVAKEPDTIRR